MTTAPNNYAYLGIVHRSLFMPLVAEHPIDGFFRLTGAAKDAPGSAEAEEVALDPYEGSAILVRGISGEEWIHSATVVEQAGQILTVVTQVLFSPPRGQGEYPNLSFPPG